jgi:dienelactone hydrolase
MLSHRTPLTILSLLVLLQSGSTARSDEKAAFVPDSFVSGGKTIRVERFEPAAKGKYPVAVFLYGVDGIHRGNATAFRGVARTQADRGFVVLIVHYLDATDNGFEGMAELLKGLRKFLLQEKGGGKEEDLSKSFAAWKQVVKDALKHARKQEKADGERVALVGLSLGGFLAAAVSSEPDHKVAAVVTLFGGIPRESAKGLQHFPPALFLTGDKDEVVPHQETLTLRDLVRKIKDARETTHVYKGVGHCFDGDLFAALQAQREVAQFLDAQLVRKGEKAPVANPVAPPSPTGTRNP